MASRNAQSFLRLVASHVRALWILVPAAIAILVAGIGLLGEMIPLTPRTEDGLPSTVAPRTELQTHLLAADVQITRTMRGGVELVRIPAGRFLMGSPESESGRSANEGPQHPVSVPALWIGRYEVTNEEYGRFLAENPDAPKPRHWDDPGYAGVRQPVVGVSWEDAQRFAQWAEARLPSEAEWEYAARAGTAAPYLDGATEADLDRVGWYVKNRGKVEFSVGEKAPNRFGLYDVLGGMGEWVEDDWHDSYRGAPADGTAWIQKPRGSSRVIRGGAWSLQAQDARAASRFGAPPTNRGYDLGFRLARSAEAE
jgi:formylglycine-generating enzyme required for sulfatase activity